MLNNSKDLIPSEDELRKVISQVMQTDPAKVPVVLLQLHFTRLIFKVVDKLRNDLDTSIKELENRIDKESKQ